MTATQQKKPNPFLAVRAAHQAGSRGDEIEATSAQEHMPASAPMHESTSAQSTIVRKPSGQRLRTDLLRAYKVLAAEEGRPLYQVMEEALEEYLVKKRTTS